MISVIVPTYQEAENLSLLIEAIDGSLSGMDDAYEVLVVDDDSRDGTEEVCAKLARAHPVRLIVRRGERGLATAVIRGIEASSGEIIVVMDADLSHPASAIPIMVERLKRGESDFVIGSRYARGGSIHGGWTPFRKLNSLVPLALAKPLCPLADPMSGFFALRRADVPEGSRLSPVGYKIALEIFVKGDFEMPSEVPIHFGERRFGQSKLSFKEQLNFVRHLGRLYAYKLGFSAAP